jgi:carbon-monoxide dehydrogenase large subunit
MRQAGVVMAKAGDQIIERGARIAAWLLEAADADIEFTRGRFGVRGTDRAVGLFDVARAALRADAPAALAGPLAGESDQTNPMPSFPYGCAVCEVEVDPETGVVEVVRWTCVDDCGRAVNPMILHGQTHGGIAAGVGQALWEDCHYAADGQMLAATFMDYTLPRADDVPNFSFATHNVPCKANPLGVKGAGEAGAIGAPPAVINAIVDALHRKAGIAHIDMPATPHRIWQALAEAGVAA